jgi:hypothetical protein
MRVLVLLALALPACTFLVVRPQTPPPSTDGGTDGGTTGGGPQCPVVTSAKNPTADLLVFVRMSGQTAALADAIDTIVSSLESDIESRKVTVTHILLAPLVAEASVAAPFYFNSCSAPAPTDIGSTLQYFAALVPQPTLTTCEHEEAAALGADLTTILPSYPADFLGGTDEPPDAPFFTTPPTYVLVVFIDPLARAHSLAASQVGGEAVDAYFTAAQSGALDWLAYGTQHMPASHVFYLAIDTSEFSETVAAMDKRCLQEPGFSESLLDYLAPADFAYFSSFNASVNAAYRARSSVIDFCTVLSADGPQAITSTVSNIHAALGLQK